MTEPGRYPIKKFVRLTGVSAATLRSWERRYGIPNPVRDGSGYRLYRDEDLELVRRMVELVDDGHSASSAARAAAKSVDRDLRPEPVEAAMEALLRASVSTDPIRVESELRRAAFMSKGGTLVDRVVRPLFEHPELTGPQIRLLRASAAGVVGELLRLSQPEDGALVLRCGGLMDTDTFAADGFALKLSGWGYRSFSIGAAVTPAELKQAVRRYRPVLVVIGIDVLPESVSDQMVLLDGYAAAAGSTVWVVSGLAASALRAGVEDRRGFVSEADSGLKRRIERAIRVRN
ncbi:MAG: MerR family transcriptional regulator [Myxococcota bacterium]